MTDIHENINSFINDLLHIGDVKSNKLIDVYAGNKESTFLLSSTKFEDFSAFLLGLINAYTGKIANVALSKSALVSTSEQIIGQGINVLEWCNANGEKNVEFLHKKFISGVYKDLAQKGTNPLYLTLGSLNWQVDMGKNQLKEVVSPVLIFPIKLIRADASNTPVFVEFINDDVFINPCLLAKLSQVYGDNILKNFPHPDESCTDLYKAVELDDLGDGSNFFERLNNYVCSCNKNAQGQNSGLFNLNKHFATIISYNHDEICMYYDIQKHKEQIYSNPLIARIFNKKPPIEPLGSYSVNPQFVEQHDSIQEHLIKRVVNGESLIIKGPPGTGKTLTITNMVASLLAENKKVLLCSQKLGALAEIQAKLPESLRKFTMLLDCESEAQTAKLNPAEVRADFIALLNAKKRYSIPSGLGNQMSLQNQKMYASSNLLKKHKQIMFGDNNIIGKNYFEVLDMLLGENIQPVEFLPPQVAHALPVETVNVLCQLVEEGATAFRRIAQSYSIEKSPFMPLDRNVDDITKANAYEKMQQIVATAQSLLQKVNPTLEQLGIDKDSFTLAIFAEILQGNLNCQLLKDLAEKGNLSSSQTQAVCNVLQDYLASQRPLSYVEIANEQAVEQNCDAICNVDFDANITASQLSLLCQNFDVLKNLDSPTKRALLDAHVQNLNKLVATEKELQDQLFSILRADLTADQLQLVAKAVSPLTKYFDGTKSKLSAFDFKAKNIVKKLVGFGYGDTLSFEQIVNAVKIYDSLQKNLALQSQAQVTISSVLHVKLSENQLSAILLLLKRSQAVGLDAHAYVTKFANILPTANVLLSAVSCPQDCSLAEIKKACQRHCLKKLLYATVIQVASATDDNVVEVAKSIRCAKKLYESGIFGNDIDKICDTLENILLSCNQAKPILDSLLSQMETFRKECYQTFHTSVELVTFAQLELFVQKGADRNLLGATQKYLQITQSAKSANLDKFFAHFEKGGDQTHSIEQIFLHSIYALAVQHRLSTLEDRNGWGEQVEDAYDDYHLAEQTLFSLTAQNIEKLCMSRIDVNDPNFAFLNTTKSSGETLRLLFKKNAQAIVNLKKCFLLSPSTVSVLLTQQPFFQFDVVICDEASQLEPTALLPLVIRSKQLVLVGDEWQMPPIKRGVAKAEKIVDEGDGDYTVLSPDISALGLALTNQSLPVEKLSCHYRSETEGLIAFSQERFYPFMRTFPAVLPKAEGIGMTDIFVPNGLCDGGENLPEAEQVLHCLRNHFDRYFDEKTGKLSQSVGVVCFGGSQVALVERLIKFDQTLAEKINRAKVTFPDEAKEKLFFIKPIDKVQGQEINHLILSLTYGKNKNGKIVNAFAELNRGDNGDKLGQCIFNVAITRAKNSVTVIHSIQHYDITAPSISYVADYLKLVERFKKGGRQGFVGGEVDVATGFIKDVANTLVANGIDAERIVVNYGGTNGSVKIPLVILDETKTVAKFGIWCEMDTKRNYNYFDYNLKYYQVLKSRGWQMSRLFIHDWYDNNVAEKQKLIAKVKQYI